MHGFAEQNRHELEELLVRHGRDRDRVEKSENPLEERAILYGYENAPELRVNVERETYHQTNEDKELLEQSEEAAKTPFKKSSLDSKSQWQFIGLETLAMQEAEKRDINIQRDFENAQTMSNDHDMGMER